jgi:hypothetical protein
LLSRFWALCGSGVAGLSRKLLTRSESRPLHSKFSIFGAANAPSMRDDLSLLEGSLMASPRITLSLTADLFEMWLNPEGRDLLVQKLQALTIENEHFHLGPAPVGELEIAAKAYRDGDRVLEWGKVYLRTDEWDEKYFPHVLK